MPHESCLGAHHCDSTYNDVTHGQLARPATRRNAEQHILQFSIVATVAGRAQQQSRHTHERYVWKSHLPYQEQAQVKQLVVTKSDIGSQYCAPESLLARPRD